MKREDWIAYGIIIFSYVLTFAVGVVVAYMLLHPPMGAV
jgi:hypothetical protein